MGKSSVTDADLGTRFDEVRATLLGDRYTDRLEKPLEYWALPSDRRLPLALLDRKVGELLSTPFAELSATPGIGDKKIQSLVKLLNRATQDGPPVAESETAETAQTRQSAEPDNGLPRFNPAGVSEALWAEWRDAVRQSGIQHEKLGHLAPSLQRLPTVIWETPLSFYLDHTVSEIRQLKTHGEKRVRCVLEVFHAVYHKLRMVKSNPGSPATSADALETLTASWVKQLREWVATQMVAPRMPTEVELRTGFMAPILDMIRVDCGPTVYQLVVERLGHGTEQRSVRDQARSLGVTRARVYQLLDDCGKVMSVRWPDGSRHLDALVVYLGRFDGDSEILRGFFGLRELCFPTRDGASDRASARASDGGADMVFGGQPVSNVAASSAVTRPEDSPAVNANAAAESPLAGQDPEPDAGQDASPETDQASANFAVHPGSTSLRQPLRSEVENREAATREAATREAATREAASRDERRIDRGVDSRSSVPAPYSDIR